MARSFLRVFGRLKADGGYEPVAGWETSRLARRAHADPAFTLELQDERGARLAIGALERRLEGCSRPGLRTSDVDRIIGQILLHPQATTLVLSHHDAILYKSAIASQPPTIRSIQLVRKDDQTWHVEWQAEHSKPLTYNLVFIDPLRRTVPIARGLNATSFTLDTSRLPGGGACRIALLATDGTRSTCLRSDPFEVRACPPDLFILVPGMNEVVQPDQPFSLIGRAHDAAGRELPATGISWRIDDEVVAKATGVVLVGPLRPGEHVIEMEHLDSAGTRTIVRTNISVAALTCDHHDWRNVQQEIETVRSRHIHTGRHF
jgi:hypothetical protein